MKNYFIIGILMIISIGFVNATIIKPNYPICNYGCGIIANYGDVNLTFDNDWNTYASITPTFVQADYYGYVFNNTPTEQLNLIFKPYIESGGVNSYIQLYNFTSNTYDTIYSTTNVDNGTIFNFTINNDYISINRDIVMLYSGTVINFNTFGVYDISIEYSQSEPVSPITANVIVNNGVQSISSTIVILIILTTVIWLITLLTGYMLSEKVFIFIVAIMGILLLLIVLQLLQVI